jgi:heme/copper-type cytochrome/quinol oxidase subunit 4/ribosomal protein S27AE
MLLNSYASITEWGMVRLMVYCPKCGTQVEENMTFCPRCGAPLKAEAPAPVAPRNEKAEKQEKGEKQEKQEKGETHEKGEFGFIGWLIGGLIMIAIGAMAFLSVTYPGFNSAIVWALFLLVLGIVIIIAAIYFVATAKKHTPMPPPV